MPEEEIIIPDEPQFRLQYALLSAEDYVALNLAIGNAKGYPDTVGTARYAPDVPQMSAEILDEQNNVITPSFCVMPITAEIQKLFPEVIQGVILHENYTKRNDPGLNEMV